MPELAHAVIAAVAASLVTGAVTGALTVYVTVRVLSERLARAERDIVANRNTHDGDVQALRKNVDALRGEVAAVSRDVSYIRGRIEGPHDD